jgi:hypothetical protein
MVRKVIATTTSAVAVRFGAALLEQAEAALQPFRQRARERRLADDAVEHADRGDADLDGGEELGRVVVQFQRRRGAGLAGLDHHLQARLAARRQRHLRHGKPAVQQDQEQEKRGVHRCKKKPQRLRREGTHCLLR